MNQSIGHAYLIHPITYFLLDHRSSYYIHLIHNTFHCLCVCVATQWQPVSKEVFQFYQTTTMEFQLA